jgi:CHAD domain-containing protein
LRDELHWLANRLGEVRDDDVMAQRLTAAVHAEPPELVLGPVAARIQSQLAAHGAQARVALVEALDSDRYQRLITQSAALAAALTTGVPKKRLRRLAAKALRRADARLKAADRADPIHRDTRMHAARRAYKRARYAAEALRPVAGRPAKQLAQRLSACRTCSARTRTRS